MKIKLYLNSYHLPILHIFCKKFVHPISYFIPSVFYNHCTICLPSFSICKDLHVLHFSYGNFCFMTITAFLHFATFLGDLFALCYRTVVCLSVLSCPVLSCLSVTLVYCGQAVGWIKIKLGMDHGGRPRLWPHCVRWGPSSPSPKGAQPPPQFSAHVYCGQTVAHLSYSWALVKTQHARLIYVVKYFFFASRSELSRFLGLGRIRRFREQWRLSEHRRASTQWSYCICLYHCMTHHYDLVLQFQYIRSCHGVTPSAWSHFSVIANTVVSLQCFLNWVYVVLTLSCITQHSVLSVL